ncbi:MAG: hypothetical protein RIG82_03150 [Phycisphaeraceae bacterium]
MVCRCGELGAGGVGGGFWLVGLCAWLFLAVFMVGEVVAGAVISEWYPAHESGAGSWPAMVEVDGLAEAQVYDLLMVNASDNVADRGLVLGVARVERGLGAGRVLLADDGVGEAWLTLGATRPPESEALPLGPGWRPQVPVTVMLIEGDSGLSRWSVLGPERLDDPVWRAMVVDSITLTAGEAESGGRRGGGGGVGGAGGVTPVLGGLEGSVLTVPGGFGAVLASNPAELVNQTWYSGVIQGGFVRTEEGLARPSPGRPNPALVTLPEPSGVVSLLMGGLMLGARGRRRRVQSYRD